MSSSISMEETNNSAQDDPTPKTKAATPPPGPNIPNGGFQAWMQVAGSFFLYFNGWGLVSSYGVYQTYYELDLLAHNSASDIAWIGSLQSSLLLLIGAFTGPIYDWGYFRALIFVGCFLEVFGMAMLSFCKSYWEVMLAQGLVVGVGCGCIFIPSVAILPTYFSTKRGVANGIAASGGGLGGVIYTIIFRQLQSSIGFGWATRVNAFVMLATSIVPLAAMNMRSKPPAIRKIFEPTAWKGLPYVFWTLAMTAGLLGLYTPLVYVETYAIENGIMSTSNAFYLLPILNAGSIFGRILPNFFVDKTGPLNMYILTCVAASVLVFAWIAIKSTAGLVVFCVVYGATSGLYLTLPAVAVISLSPHLGVLGVRMGMSYSIGAIGILIGTPIAGAIVKTGWVGLQVWGGATLVLGTILMVAARVSKVGYKISATA